MAKTRIHSGLLSEGAVGRLKTTKTFDATLVPVTVRGVTFDNVNSVSRKVLTRPAPVIACAALAALLALGSSAPRCFGVDLNNTTAAVLYARPLQPTKPAGETSAGATPIAPAQDALPVLPVESKPPGEEIAVSFRHLDFRPANELDLGIVADTRFLEKAPPHIRALDRRLVRITGYMMPVRMEEGKVRECIVVPSQLQCCFGKVPRFCEFVVAKTKGEPIPKVLDQPVVFHGTLSVGDVFEQGYWVTFYTLDCTRIDP